MVDNIDALIADVTTDADNPSEQLWSFRQAFEEIARFPLRATIVGVDVTVTEVDFDGDERRGLVALCQRAGEKFGTTLLEP
jgi:hypothetical protein